MVKLLQIIEPSEITSFFYNNFSVSGGGGFPPVPPGYATAHGKSCMSGCLAKFSHVVHRRDIENVLPHPRNGKDSSRKMTIFHKGQVLATTFPKYLKIQFFYCILITNFQHFPRFSHNFLKNLYFSSKRDKIKNSFKSLIYRPK